MGVQSQEILQFDNLVAENATNINNQTCEAKVNTYMFKMMDRTFNEVSIKSEGIFKRELKLLALLHLCIFFLLFLLFFHDLVKNA